MQDKINKHTERHGCENYEQNSLDCQKVIKA